MLQPISSLPLPNATISQLKDHGFLYVEDIRHVAVSESSTCFYAIQEAQKFCNTSSSGAALDILKEELREYKISTLSKELDKILDGGFRCKTITELSGAPGSGKTQICLQLCISVQLTMKENRLKGEVLYVDTRSGVSVRRLKDMAMSCRAYVKDENFDVDEILDRIIVASPQTYDEIFTILENFEHVTGNRQIRLVVVDSIAFLRYSIEDPFNRTQICFKILNKLHELSIKYNFVVVVTNELITQMLDKGEVDLTPAGGVFCAHKIHTRIMLTRLDDKQFAGCVIKSLMLPKVSSKFQITADGIRDITD